MKKIFAAVIFAVLLAVFSCLAQDSDNPEYRIGKNDLLEISVYQEPDLYKTVRVSEQGMISFPLIGNISVVGMAVKDLQDKLTELLERDYLVNPQVSVFIKEYSKVSVLGEVGRPGAYELKSGLTAIEAIALAGGFKDSADEAKVMLSREDKYGGKESIEIDTTDPSGKNIILRPGDVITVRELGSISVLGRVKKPGRYSLRKGISVIEAIALAGGLDDMAAANSTQVIRIENGRKKIFRVPVASILQGGDRSKDIDLLPDDTVVVPESFF